MSGLAIHYRTFDGGLRRPTGTQPTLWLQPRSAHVAATPVTDHRTTPPAGLALTGSLPVAANYGAGKLAWQLDGSTAITASGVGLTGRHQLTVLMAVSFANQVGQHYFFTYGGGSNTTPQSFDAYSNESLINFRVRDDTTQSGASLGYMNAPGDPSAFAASLDFGRSTPYDYIEPQTSQRFYDYGQPAAITWGNQTLYITQGQNGAIPLPPGSKLRYFLVFNEALGLDKCEEWLTYLANLP